LLHLPPQLGVALFLQGSVHLVVDILGRSGLADVLVKVALLKLFSIVSVASIGGGICLVCTDRSLRLAYTG